MNESLDPRNYSAIGRAPKESKRQAIRVGRTIALVGIILMVIGEQHGRGDCRLPKSDEFP